MGEIYNLPPIANWAGAPDPHFHLPDIAYHYTGNGDDVISVAIKIFITRERCEMEETLQQNADSKLGSAFQKTHLPISPGAPFMPKS